MTDHVAELADRTRAMSESPIGRAPSPRWSSPSGSEARCPTAQLDQIAEYRCTSRSFLIRELAEAAVDGRVYLDLLRAGGSRSPEELGEIVGVDLTATRASRARVST
jgi:hypothetical protein